MSLKKCPLGPSMRLVCLAIVCDTNVRRFKVPQDNLDKLEAYFVEPPAQVWISFALIEKVAGTCTSMSVAVPPGSIYTHFMNKRIAKYKRKGVFKLTHLHISPESGLRFEIVKWHDSLRMRWR